MMLAAGKEDAMPNALTNPLETPTRCPDCEGQCSMGDCHCDPEHDDFCDSDCLGNVCVACGEVLA